MYFEYILQFISILILIVSVLVAVAFFTLFERKLLGYIQLRKGPNKVGVVGILQPFSDAIKLFCKEYISPQLSNFFPYLIAPILSLSLSLIGWMVLPLNFNLISFELSVMFFLCCVGMGVYMLLAAGWSSNSKYSLLGSLRGVAQTISYEVSLVLILLGPMILVGSFSWLDFFTWQDHLMFFFVMPASFLMWFISCLAETNRTPFDFAEGESELVSGYNTEYGSSSFALLMLAEYTSILLMSMFTSFIFFSSIWIVNFFMFTFMAFFFVWVRGTLPRFRYDKLMHFAWTNILPFSLMWLILIAGLCSNFI